MPHTHLKTYLASIQDISPAAKEHSHRTSCLLSRQKAQ